MKNIISARKSGIELLKIIAMLIICFFHASQTMSATIDIPYYYNFIEWLGQFGNILFVICSSWFLLDKCLCKAEKVFNILLDSMLISIIILVSLLAAKQVEPSKSIIIHNIFPDIFANVWFIPTYIMLFLVHPLLNFAIERLTHKMYFTILLVCLILFGILGFINLAPGISLIGDFLLIYLIVGYIKKFGSTFIKKNITLFVVCLISFILIFGCLTIKWYYPSIGGKISPNSLYNILYLGAGLSLFGLFYKLDFHSKFINYWSSLTLFIYAIHENILLRTYIRTNFYKWALNTYPNISPYVWIVVCGLVMFFGGSIISLFYKISFHRLTPYLSNKIANLWNHLVEWLYAHLPKCKDNNTLN